MGFRSWTARAGGARLLPVLVLLLAAGLTLLGVRWLRPEPGSPRDAATPSTSHLTERLDRIEAALERLALGLEGNTLPGPTGVRSPAPVLAATDGAGDPEDEATRRAPATEPERTERLLAALLRMEDALRAEHEHTRDTIREEAVRGLAVARIRELGGEVAWHAWDPILELWDEDRDAARREVKLLTDVEVLDRFGPPTDVWSNTSGITWQYAKDLDPVTGEPGTEVILRMPAGYVTQLAVRR